jgi:hypothetical protein
VEAPLTSKLLSVGRLIVAVTIVIGTASSVAAQSSVEPNAKAGSGHSVWFDTLLGMAIGGAAGAGAGAVRANFHKAECAVLAAPSADFPNSCDHSLEVSVLAPTGAAIGAAAGFLIYHHGQQDKNSSSVFLAPSYSRARAAMFVSWLWRK